MLGLVLILIFINFNVIQSWYHFLPSPLWPLSILDRIIIFWNIKTDHQKDDYPKKYRLENNITHYIHMLDILIHINTYWVFIVFEFTGVEEWRSEFLRCCSRSPRTRVRNRKICKSNQAQPEISGTSIYRFYSMTKVPQVLSCLGQHARQKERKWCTKKINGTCIAWNITTYVEWFLLQMLQKCYEESL